MAVEDSICFSFGFLVFWQIQEVFLGRILKIDEDLLGLFQILHRVRGASSRTKGRSYNCDAYYNEDQRPQITERAVDYRKTDYHENSASNERPIEWTMMPGINQDSLQNYDNAHTDEEQRPPVTR